LYFEVRVQCRRKKFTFTVSATDEFLVNNNNNDNHSQIITITYPTAGGTTVGT